MPERGRRKGTPPPTPPAPFVDAESPAAAHSETPGTFPIVAVGASAGGIAPFLELLESVGENPGMAFVYVLHQERHDDGLAPVVSRATAMPVLRAEDGMAIEIDHVYVTPSNAILTLTDGHFSVRERGQTRGMPIDELFRSLAEHHGERAIGVVLSGSDSDGALGTKAIKAAGGITFAQDATAKFPLMPHAAVSIGAIDFVLAPSQIGAELLRIVRHDYVSGGQPRLPESERTAIFRLLHAIRDIDFTHYKPNTVERRIRRRMALHKIEDVGEYLRLLREDRREVDHLCADILIRVTGFFRDPEVFATLQQEILPGLLADRVDPLRIWVPGCATGEEVYSLAIAVLELAPEGGFGCPIQIFGTDVSESAVQSARLGFYPETIVADVSPERLKRFFIKDEGMVRIRKEVRDCCIFARQNLTRDPPFSRLDLISCRNVLIYLGPMLQRKVMSVFHYALLPGRYLVLGSSESIGAFGELFSIVDRRHRIYQKRPATSRMAVDFDPVAAPEQVVERTTMHEVTMPPGNVFREADRVTLSRYSPPGVVINEQMDVLQFRGRTSLFLEPPSGTASFNLLKMAREGLLADLRAAILAARKQKTAVRREGIRVKSNGDTSLVDVEVIPFRTPTGENCQVVLFEARPEPETRAKGRRKKGEPEVETRQSVRLRRELDATREYLQSIIEEQESMNEELRSASEEVQSSNEELQSTNEELETAKEELQSSNEELITLNEELEHRNEDLAKANNDLVNLLAAVDLPILMLDSHLRIRRFNPGAQRALNLMASDVGRSIEDLNTTLELKNLERMIADVIDNLEVLEQQVVDRNGRRYSMRVRPYKTTDNRIEGAVILLIDKRG